jgi:hypothetical protein
VFVSVARLLCVFVAVLVVTTCAVQLDPPGLCGLHTKALLVCICQMHGAARSAVLLANSHGEWGCAVVGSQLCCTLGCSPGSLPGEELVLWLLAAALFGMLRTQFVLACVCWVCGRLLS